MALFEDFDSFVTNGFSSADFTTLTDLPHCEQNLSIALREAPHSGHERHTLSEPTGKPQLLQKFASSGNSVAHFIQLIILISKINASIIAWISKKYIIFFMKKIPGPSKKRLFTLARLLSQQKKEKITSVELSSLTGWGEATIRRDISLLELHNGVSNGYDVKILHDAICAGLQIDSDQNEKHRCCIVGLGKLGEALLESSVFKGSSFELVAGFDTNFNKIEIMKTEIPLFATLDLEKKIRSLKIEYAVLAVPDEKAQFMADRLVACGIKGIVNYTNTVLSVPKEVRVEHVNTAVILAGMCAC